MGRSLVQLAAALAAAASAAAAPLAASNLQVEYVTDPIALDPFGLSGPPRFFWLPQADAADRGVTQSAYRIQVNNSLSGATVWDSGVVASNASTHVEYAGAALESDTVYTWAVQWTDGQGAAAPWSAPARFGTGLLTQAEWAPSDWIGCPAGPGGPGPNYNQLRAEFSLPALPAGTTIVQARAYVTAVGYYGLRVNGDWAAQWGTPRPRLDPTWSTYEVRSFYSAYDITAQLSATGSNAIGLILGNGWPQIDPVPGNSTGVAGERALTDNTGVTREARLQIHVRTSDGSTTVWASTAGSFAAGAGASGAWSCGMGAQWYDDVYNGVTQNGTLFPAGGWDTPGGALVGSWVPAVLKADPGGATPTTMTAQVAPAIGVVLELPAIGMWSPAPGKFVLDFGQNLAGVLRMTLPAPVPAGLAITLRHAEVLQHPPYGPQDGNVYTANLRSARATDVYVTTGGVEAEVFEPFGTYHGFRYVEVTYSGAEGYEFVPQPDWFTALHMRTAVPAIGSVAFPAGNATIINSFVHNAEWAVSNNLMGVLSDCPQRDERKGWMGDAGLSLMPMSFSYAMAPIYTSFALNIRDAQAWTGDAHAPGAVPDTVPHTFGAYPADPAWGTAYPGIIYTMWRWFGDARLAADHWAGLTAYITFMAEQVNSTGIARTFQRYGDWCPPPAQQGGGQGIMPPQSYTSAISVLNDLQRMAEMAAALGKADEAAAYARYRAALVADFNAAWLNATTGVYGAANGDGLQTANAIAIGLDLVPAAANSAVAAALENDLVSTHGGAFSTGIIGMRWLHSSLTAIGAGEAAVSNFLRTDYPSYGYMITNPFEPATSLWELTDAPAEGPGMNSRSHHMFSSPLGWLYQDLLGIDQRRSYTAAYDPADPDASGWHHAVLFPRVVTHAAVPWAEGEYASVSGTYGLSWTAASAVQGSTCAADVAEGAQITLSCPPGGGTFNKVVFASYGTPSGTCGAFSKGSCDLANTSAIVGSYCLGQASCSFNISDTTAGDPCYGTLKHLDVQLSCSGGGPGVAMTVTVPPNAAATVRIPFPASQDLTKITAYESGALFFSQGAYKPGVPGVAGAAPNTAVDLPAGIVTLDVEVGSGTYSFSVTMGA